MLKSGDFAKKFDVSVDTVRFYADQGLLVPVIKNKRFYYDSDSEKDMKLILKMKDMHFSLNEINIILKFKRFHFAENKETKDFYIEFFEKKEKELLEILEKAKKSYDMILDFKKELLEKYEKKDDFVQLSEFSFKKGIPIEFLNKLCCEKCQSNLLLNNVKISNNEILEGDLCCEHCDNILKIKDGIIFLDSKVDNFEGEERKNNLDSFYVNYRKNISGEFISPIFRCARTLSEELNSNLKNEDVILEMGSGLGSFMLGFLSSTSKKNFYYIANDNEIALAKYSKKLYEENNINVKTIFICGDCKKLPLKKESVNFVIDFVSLYSYFLNDINSDIYYKYLAKYLKLDGKFLSANLAFNKGDIKFEKQYKKIENFMIIEKLKEELIFLKEISIKHEGGSKDKGDFFGFTNFKEVNYYSIIGKK
jgi:DNA-binding transcriptional MerR regulator/uncharacterized protein YbaR (Trm112 family)